MAKNNNQTGSSTYYEDEKTTLENLENINNSGYVPGLVNTAANALGSVPGAIATGIDNVTSGYNAAQVDNSVVSGITSATRVNTLVEGVTSERKTFWQKVGSVFSWTWDRVTGAFSSLVPFGKTAQDAVEHVENLETTRDTVTAVRDAMGLGSDEIEFDVSKSDVKDVFHTEDKTLLDMVAKTLDQNKDGKVDKLEFESAKKLLDTNNDGKVTQEEINALGGIQGALKFLEKDNKLKNEIDKGEYTETFARHNLVRTLGENSQSVVGSRFNELDVDGKDGVTRDEYRTALGALDKNKDGTVSKEEAEAFHEDPNRALDLMKDRLNQLNNR